MPRTEKPVGGDEGARDSSSGDDAASRTIAQKRHKASNHLSNTGLLGYPTLRERGLLLSGNSTRTSLLNEKDGILSFLSPKEAVAVLQTSKKHTDDVEQEERGAAPSISNASENNSVKAASWEQYRHDSKLENRTESCEDLWLEILRERVGTKKPRDYWNTMVDMGADYLEKFQAEVERPQEEVRFLMTMARGMCSPARVYESVGDLAISIRSDYDSDKLRKGCHKSDRAFFREVLDFFHEEVSPARLNARTPSKRRKEKDGATKRGEKDEKRKWVLTWNPPKAHAFSLAPADFAAPVDMARNRRGRRILDARCRLATATELLFQNYHAIYDQPRFPVKLGYCLSPELKPEPMSYRNAFVRTDPLDDTWHPFFRKMFRKFAQKWRAGSNGKNSRWSYDQFQWDWRSLHAKRLKNTGMFGKYLPGRKPRPLPSILADNPERYSVSVPTKIDYET
ncbi:unnamed protein product [Amoebophrya sp. A120]|nr:unnamed protein product [Amoebophrya sp. A120]|eukprot:GSA120T00025945001.1